MTPESQDASALDQFRAEFDRGFINPASDEATERAELLSFAAGEGSYAVYLRDVAAVREIRAVTRVPCRRLGFEGIVAVQGQLVAVYDLAVLLAAPGVSRSRRWLLSCREDHQIGFAIDAVEGYMQLARGQIAQAAEKDQRQDAVRQVIAQGPKPRLVVDFRVLLAAIRHDIEREGRVLR